MSSCLCVHMYLRVCLCTERTFINSEHESNLNLRLNSAAVWPQADLQMFFSMTEHATSICTAIWTNKRKTMRDRITVPPLKLLHLLDKLSLFLNGP